MEIERKYTPVIDCDDNNITATSHVSSVVDSIASLAACKTASVYPEKDGLEFLALRAFGEERREDIEEETVLRACIALDAAGPNGKSIDGDW